MVIFKITMFYESNFIMKRLYFILSFFFFSLSANFAQSKEDVLSALQLIFEHPELERAYQHEVSEGLSIVIRTSSDMRRGYNLTSDILNQLRQDDFYYFDRPVKLLIGEDDIEYTNFDPQTLLNFQVNGTENQLDFFLFSGIKKEQKRYQWTFRVIKKQANGKSKIMVLVAVT